MFVIDFIAPLALISILLLNRKLFFTVYLTLSTLNKWINKREIKKKNESPAYVDAAGNNWIEKDQTRVAPRPV